MWSVYVEATIPAWVNPETGDVVSVAELLTKAGESHR